VREYPAIATPQSIDLIRLQVRAEDALAALRRAAFENTDELRHAVYVHQYEKVIALLSKAATE
jgi:hypothetical protein